MDDLWSNEYDFRKHVQFVDMFQFGHFVTRRIWRCLPPTISVITQLDRRVLSTVSPFGNGHCCPVHILLLNANIMPISIGFEMENPHISIETPDVMKLSDLVLQTFW